MELASSFQKSLVDLGIGTADNGVDPSGHIAIVASVAGYRGLSRALAPGHNLALRVLTSQGETHYADFGGGEATAFPRLVPDLGTRPSAAVPLEGARGPLSPAQSQAILARLAALACDEAQGYHVSRPVPVPDFLAFAERWRTREGAAAVLH